MSKNNLSECVGSLVVHSSDVQELSEVHSNINVQDITETIKDELKHDECVGSLLVHTSDMQELSSLPEGGSNIQRRVTDHLNKTPEITKEEIMDLYNDV